MCDEILKNLSGAKSAHFEVCLHDGTSTRLEVNRWKGKYIVFVSRTSKLKISCHIVESPETAQYICQLKLHS